MTCECEKDNELKIKLEGLRESEVHLGQLNSIAASADSRAMAFTGLAGVIGTLLLSTATDVELPVINYVAAILVFLGAIGTASSCMPRGFYVSGDRYEQWKFHANAGDPFVEAVDQQGKENDDRIAFNEAKLKEAASKFQTGVWLVLIPSLLAPIIQLISKIN